MTEKLTVAEAHAQGYKYCAARYEEISELLPIEECPFDKVYVLLDKEPRPYQIASDTIMDLMDSYLSGQDDVADGNGKLNDIAAEIDYTSITKKINDAFEAQGPKYYHQTQIVLIK